MEEPEINRSLLDWIISLAIVVLVVSLFLGTLEAPTLAFVLLAAPALRYLAIAIHEFGHVVAGISSGQRILLVSVDCLAWHIHNAEIVFDSRVRREDAGGWVAAVPRQLRFDTPLRHTITSLGGPAASLAAFALALWLLDSMRSEPKLLALPGQALVLIFAAFNLYCFAKTIVPDGRNNDGQQILNHWRQDPATKSLQPLSFAQFMLGYNVRLRDLPDWTVAPLPVDCALRDSVRFLATVQCGRCLDAEQVDPQEARRRLEAFREEYGSDEWSSLCLAFLCCVHERNLAEAKDLFEDLTDPSGLPQMRHAVAAAIAMLEGKRDLAQAQLWEMDKVIDAMSPYANRTFIDIRRDVEAIEPLQGQVGKP